MNRRLWMTTRRVNNLSDLPISFRNEIKKKIRILSRINRGQQWLKRFDQLISSVGRNRKGYYQIEQHIFELKVISYLLDKFQISSITYEPHGNDPNGKRMDLLVAVKGKDIVVELKAFRPKWKTTRIPFKNITDYNRLIMDQHTYHQYQSVRDHLIDETLDAETKAENYPADCTKVLGLLTDFFLKVEDLRDFVALYRHGKYRSDDPLGKMSIYKLNQQNISFKGIFQKFWSFPFEQCSFEFKGSECPLEIAPLRKNDLQITL